MYTYDANMNKVAIKEQYAPSNHSSKRMIRENFSMKGKNSWVLWLIIAVAVLSILGIIVYVMRKNRKEGMAVPAAMRFGRQKFGFRFY